MHTKNITLLLISQYTQYVKYAMIAVHEVNAENQRRRREPTIDLGDFREDFDIFVYRINVPFLKVRKNRKNPHVFFSSTKIKL